ncbi:MAG: hypothetical protein OEX07_10265, partial [Gammaproteobacteria bacterium]|nr:hypothetical protein [Gammaproteobacteria bacterium]
FVAEGDMITPFVLGSSPYDSTITLDTVTTGQRHLVDSGMMSSYYSVPVSASTSYTVTLSAPTDDIDLYVFTTSDFVTTPFCTSVTAGVIDESCNAITGAGETMLYIRVDYIGGGLGASFDILVN